MNQEILNVAIIAHVDHGKTTLTNNLLKQIGAMDQVGMDRNPLEQKRGITMFSKVASVCFDKVKINIIDTPGHSDFGGEVERIMCMADSALLLVDSSEGVMPQTKFVLQKALNANLRLIVLINKVDKQDSRIGQVVEEISELFLNLEANDDQLDFPVLYGSGRDGWCVNDLKNDTKDNLEPLLHAIIKHTPKVKYDLDAPFAMLVTMLESDKFLGKILIGKVKQGKAQVNMNVKAIDLGSSEVESGRLTKLQTFSGMIRNSVDQAVAGDIVALAGLEKASVTDTICDLSVSTSISSAPIDPTTISVNVSANTSPFAGKDGDKLTSRVIRDRLLQEAKTNVSIKIEELGDGQFEVKGRGELQLGVLIETMRKEGFELSVARPRVILKIEDGQKMEPVEELTIDLDQEYSGVVMDTLNNRKGILQSMENHSGNRLRLFYHIPARSLIGYYGQFLSDTRGSGILNKSFLGYEKHSGQVASKKNGALVSVGQGEAVAYAIFNLQDRGKMFIKPQDPVYNGMVVGEHNRSNDLDVNVLKGKQLTNVRASGSDEAIKLDTPVIMSLEEMISYIGEDELLEVTPNALRLRKKILDSNERKRSQRNK